MNLLHLRTFLEVIRAGSFAEAARTLSYTPSAVSQQIGALESDLGVRLFERIGRRVLPTGPGLLLAERGLDTIERLDNLRREVTDSGVEGGHVRIGAFPSAAAKLVPRALLDIGDRLPAVNVTMYEGEPDELLPELVSGALDLVIAYTYAFAPRHWPTGVLVNDLMDEHLYLLVGRKHRLSSTPAPRLGDYRSDSWVSIRSGTEGDHLLSLLCAAEGFSPRISYRCNDYEVIRELVKAGLGVALVTTLSLTPQSRLIARRLGSRVERQVVALQRESSTSPLVGELLSSLRRSARRHTRAVASDGR